jgi:hypothetical protein
MWFTLILVVTMQTAAVALRRSMDTAMALRGIGCVLRVLQNSVAFHHAP